MRSDDGGVVSRNRRADDCGAAPAAASSFAMRQLPHSDAAQAGADADEPALRVVIADDHPLFRAGIVRALDGDPRFAVVGEAGDGVTAERMIHEREPDLALLERGTTIRATLPRAASPATVGRPVE